MTERAHRAAIRVLCVDDNELVVEGLEVKLALSGGFEWMGRLGSADELIEQVDRLAPDVVLLDIDMPGRDPLEALAELTARRPQTRVIMLTGLSRATLVDRAVEAGAWGYLSKYADVERIVSAIRRVQCGEFVLESGEDDPPSARHG